MVCPESPGLNCPGNARISSGRACILHALPQQLLAALLPIIAIYAVWDIVGIIREHWWYSAQYTTGILLPLQMPIEELVFFIVIPLCGLLTYEAVGYVLGLWRRLWERRSARA